MTARVGIVGVTGYAGAELVRLVGSHPTLELAAVAGRSRVGEALASVHPALAGLTDLRIDAIDPGALAALDAVFLAVPHGAGAALAKALDGAGAPRVLDLSADHRHAPGWVYGQAEWHREQLAGARRVAVPGCFATAISLALAPFVARGLLAGPVQCVAATGSTGSGASASAATHHPERFVNLKAYKVLAHQHTPEVTTFLRGLGRFEALHFVPLSAPLDRGILATCFLRTAEPLDDAALRAVPEAAYAGHPLVRVRDASPELRHVRGTGFCDLAVYREGDQVAVLSGIDNLGKGAAAQALQCLNLALGLPPEAGLAAPALLP